MSTRQECGLLVEMIIFSITLASLLSWELIKAELSKIKNAL